MLQLIGLNPENSLKVREKLSITPKHAKLYMEKLLNICEETIIISTCNRTEIYFTCHIEGNQIIEEVFKVLGWDTSYIKYIFYLKEEEAAKHLMEVSCGFKSKILGEDQILGQIKDAYQDAMSINSAKGELSRLFQIAITCGKEFRDTAELYKIPVSSASIVVKESVKRGLKNFMLIGYGNIGALVHKYLLGSDFENLYIVVRNPDSINIADINVKVISFHDRMYYYNNVECIISCTSAPHVVLKKEDLPDKEYLIFDLAVPRDVDEDIADNPKVDLYNIDDISILDDMNCALREEKMKENYYILDKHLKEFEDWRSLRHIAPQIEKFKKYGESVYRKRHTTFINKMNTKSVDSLAETLLKSTSDAYINRAIAVLKEEQLKGGGEECLRILEKIFYPRN